MYNCVITKRY